MRRESNQESIFWLRLDFIRSVRPRLDVAPETINRPLYVLDRQVNDQRLPVIAGITAVLRASHTLTTLSQDQIISTIVPALKSLIIDMAQTYRPSWTRQVSESRLSGVLLVSNLVTLSTQSSGHPIDFSELTFDRFFEIFEGITQSNDELTLYDVEFKFAFNPLSFNTGTGAITPFKGTPKCEKPYWKDHPTIACAAISIIGSLSRPPRTFNSILAQAATLQQELGWDKQVEITQFQDYVDRYPLKRIVILARMSNTLYTFQHESFVYREPSDNLYIVYDLMQGHYAPVFGGAVGWICRLFNNCCRLCPSCAVIFNNTQTHVCSAITHIKYKPRPSVKKCNRCGAFGEHDCLEKGCMRCKEYVAQLPEKDSQHRCPVIDEFKFTEFYKSGPLDGTTPCLFAFDCESAVDTRPSLHGQARLTNFLRDDSGRFTGDADYDTFEFFHKPTLVCVQGVHHDFKKKFEGENAFFDFVQFFIRGYNRGNNFFYAHNAKGYDSQLLLIELKNFLRGCGNKNLKNIVSLTRTGSKIMELKIGKMVIRDSICHVPGSLAALAKNFCNSSEMRKGDFPHLFHTLTRFNENYIGPIPPLEMFTPKIKNREEFEEFKSWHAQRASDPTPWNFREELVAYCENDVFLLTKIMQGFESALFPVLGASPFVKRTAPGAGHTAFLTQMFRREIDLESYPDDQKYSKLQEYVTTQTWPILRAEEHFFARKSLHGGRTEIHTLYRALSPSEKETSVIKMFDVVSMYPAIQATKLLPVGIPKIHIYDWDYIPCYIHRNYQPYTHCSCPFENRSRSLNYHLEAEPSQSQLLDILSDQSRGGFFEVKIKPPTTLRHPVLCVTKMNKLIFDCEEIDRGCFPHIAILAAIRYGYTIERIYRWDEYKMRTSLWRDFTLRLYLRKMINSKSLPAFSDCARLISAYAEMFPETEFLDELTTSIQNNTWGKNPAAKQAFKIAVNSGWGKCCQNTNMIKDSVLDTTGSNTLFYDLWHEIETRQVRVKNLQVMNESTVLISTDKHEDHGEQNLSKVYVPAAVYVPAYGQLQILEMMNHPGVIEVLMNDTDSVCAVFQKSNLPAASDILGEWEDEGFEVEEFLALAPKLYLMKLVDGKYKIACKGVSLNFETENLFNYNIVKRHILETLIRHRNDPIQIPQQTFVFDLARGMRTHKFFKNIRVNIKELKGDLDYTNGRIYPFNYTGPRHDPVDFQAILDRI